MPEQQTEDVAALLPTSMAVLDAREEERRIAKVSATVKALITDVSKVEQGAHAFLDGARAPCVPVISR
jgi:hypothetical protein